MISQLVEKYEPCFAKRVGDICCFPFMSTKQSKRDSGHDSDTDATLGTTDGPLSSTGTANSDRQTCRGRTTSKGGGASGRKGSKGGSKGDRAPSKKAKVADICDGCSKTEKDSTCVTLHACVSYLRQFMYGDAFTF